MNEDLLKFLHGKLYKDKVDYEKFKNDMSTNLDVVNYVYDKMGYGTKGILKSKFYSDLGLQPNREKGSLNDFMFELESKSLGGYKAYNGDGGGQGAVGGYQHRYEKHKNDIAKVTGVTNRDDFYNNPFAQEQYQNHLVENQYKPHLPTLRKIAKNKGLNYNDTELMYIEHHEGYQGAKNFLLTGKSDFGSEAAIANRLREGKRYWKSLGYDDSSFSGGSPVQQKILTLDQKVEKLYQQESKAKAGLYFGINKQNIRKKVYDEAFANGDLNPNDFSEEEFNQLYQEKDHNDNNKRLAEKSKKRLDNQLKDKGLFEAVGDLFARYASNIAPDGTLDTKKGKINISLKTPTPAINPFNKDNVAEQFDMFLTPEQIMKLQYHPMDKSGDPNSRLNTHLRNIQNVITESEQLSKAAESSGLNHKLKATVDYNNNIKAKLKGKGYNKDITRFEQLASLENLDEQQQVELQSLQEKLTQVPEFNEYLKNNQSLNQMKSQFDKLDNKYKKAKAFELLENSRHIDNDNYRRSLSTAATWIKAFEDIAVGTAKKLVQSPFDTARFLGTIGEATTGVDLGITDKNIIDAETEIHAIKTSKEQDGVITNKTRFTKDGNTYYGKVDADGNIEEIYDEDGYAVQFPDESIRDKYKAAAKKQYDLYGSEKDFNWTALGSGVKDTTPDLINLVLAGGIARNMLGSLSSFTRFGRLANLAKNPRVLEAAGIVPVFSGQTMKANIRDGKLTTPGEIAISTSKDLALEVLSEMMFAGPVGKILGDKGIDAARFASLTKEKTKDLIENLATGKLSKLQFTKEIAKSLAELGKDAAGEGFEELTVDLLKPVTDGFLNDYLGTSFNPEIGTLEELGSTYLVGAAAGALMGGVNFGINVSNTKNKVQDYYKSLLAGAIGNVNNGKVAAATVENPLLFKTFADKLIEEGEVSQELGNTISGIVQAAHEKSKHLFNEPTNGKFSPSDDIKSLYSISAFNAEYFSKVADRKQQLDDKNTALNDQEIEDYSKLAKFNEQIVSELNVNIANQLNSPTTPTHILNKIGAKLTEPELVSLSEKHKELAEKIGSGKGTDIQKSRLLSIGLMNAIKDINEQRKKEDPTTPEVEVPDTKEQENEIKNEIKNGENKTSVDNVVEDPEAIDDNDAIKKELLANLHSELDLAETDDDYDIIRSEPLYKSDIFQKIINEHQLNKKLDNGEEEAKLKSEEEKQKIANELINQQGTEEQDNIPPAPNGSIEDFDNIPDKTDLNDLGFDQNEIDQLRKDSLEIKKEIDLSIPPLPTLEDFDNIPNNEEAREILRAEKEKREAAKKEREEKNKKRLEEIDEKNSNKIAPTITQDVISEKDTNFMGVTPGYIDRNGEYTIQAVYEDGTTAIIKVKREIVEKGGEQSISNTEYIINQFPKKSSKLLYYHVIPNADVANLKNPLAHKVLSKITPDTTVYYEIDMDGEYNSKNPPIDKLEIDIVVYINDNDNIVPPTVEGARKIHIAKVPAFKINDNSPSNQMVKQIRDVATTVLGNNKTGLIQLGTGVVAKTHSIPNVEYGKNLDNTTKRRELIQNELESPELYVVEVPYGDKVETIQESNGRVRVKNAILRNADNSSFVTFPVPESWLGALIKKVGNKWVKFDTKTIGEVKELDEKLYSLLRTIEDSAINGKEFNPYNDYKKTWLSLIGLNKDDRSGALLRYRSNVSTIDAENEKDDIINPRGGIAPLIIYHKGKGFTIDDGLYRKEYMSANQAFEILRNKRIHISGLKLSKDNFNDDEFALYRKKITPYLHTNHKLPGDGYYITHTVLLKPELTINENLNVNSQPIQISPEPTKTVKRRFKVSNNNYSAINNPTINDNLTWFRERFKEIGIAVDDNTINQIAKLHNLGGKKVWGAFANAAVVLASDASNQVAKHEAFHVVFNLFLNDKQRSQILDEAFNKYGKELGITKEQYELAKKEGNAKDILFKAEDQVNYQLKAVDILNSPEGIKTFDKGIKNNWPLDKILTELQIPKEQKQLILNLQDPTKTRLIPKDYYKKDLREQIITDLLANYSYTVEINTAKEKYIDYIRDIEEFTGYENEYEIEREVNTQLHSDLTVNENFYKNNPDWEYRIQQIVTPNIIPSIQNHNFGSKEDNNKIGWFRAWYNKKTGEIHVLEVQSDLFQKGRDSKDLITPKETSVWNEADKGERSVQITKEEFYQLGRIENKGGSHLLVAVNKDGVRVGDANTSIGGVGKYWKYEKIVEDNTKNPTNQFLQLLNKDSNWVTFFVKSIIQDSAKKGYEKVLFPTGNTASKVEGHQTLEEAKNDILKDIEIVKSDNYYSDMLVETSPTEVTNHHQYQGIHLKKAEYYSPSPEGESFMVGNKNYKSDNFTKEYWYVEEDNNQEYGEPIFISLEEFEKAREKSTTPKPSKEKTLEYLNNKLKFLEKEGFNALKPIYKFYGIDIRNILVKQYGEWINIEVLKNKYGEEWKEKDLTWQELQNHVKSNTLKFITDEYGNTWNEITIDNTRDNSAIRLSATTPIKQGVEELFNENPELASIGTKEQYSQYLDSIFPDSKVEEMDDNLYISVLNQLEQENKIEKDCSGGKLKAEKGLQTNFTKGGEWKIYEIFEGKSHKQGGIDINIKNNQISFTNKNGSIKAKYGLVISKDN